MYTVISKDGKKTRRFDGGGDIGNKLGAASDIMQMGAAIADTAKANAKIDEQLASDRSAEQAKTAAQGYSNTSVDQLIADSENAANINTNISYKDYMSSKGAAAKNTAMGSLKAGVAGAQAGAKMGGGFGAAIGAAVGVIGGVFGGVFGRRKAKRKAKRMAAQQRETAKTANAMQDSKMDAAAENLAKKQEENAFLNSYAYGGKLKKYQEKYSKMFPDDTFYF